MFIFRISSKKYFCSKRGFTLIELLIVITIIALLASFLVINISKWRARTRDSQRTADIRTFQQGLAFYFYRSEYSGFYPTAPCNDVYITGSDCLSNELRGSGAMSTIPVDPINQDNYRYYYCSKESNCSALGGAGTGEEDGRSYLLMFYLETGSVAGKVQGQNFVGP